MGGSKYQTVGYKYFMGGMLDLCLGPIDKVLRIRADEKIAWQGSHEGGVLNIAQWNLFGGDEKEGGIGGDFNFAFGSPTQTQNAYLAARTNGLLPAYRATCAAILQRIYIGTSAYPKGMDFQLQRIFKKGIEGEAQWYSEKAGIGETLVEAAPPNYFSLSSSDITQCSNVITPSLGVTLGSPESPPLARRIGVSDFWTAWPPDWPEHIEEPWLIWFFVQTDSGPPIEFQYSGATTGEARSNFLADYPGGVIDLPESTFHQFYLYDPDPSGNSGSLTFTWQNLYNTFKGDLNPAHIIREIITDLDYGMGYTDEDIDEDSFIYAADVLYDEGFGLSFFWEGDQTAEDVLKKIVQHIDASLYISRQTGKFVLKLHRGDYDSEDLPIFDVSNSDSFTDYSKNTFGELTTTVTVNYWNEETVNTATVTVSDTALAQDQGREKAEIVTFDYICNAELATRIGWRELKLKSSEFISGKLNTGKAGKQINPGDVFILNWGEYGIENIVMRCNGVTYGDGKSNKIILSCVQDIFSLPDNALFAPPVVEWEDPNQEPEEITVKKVFELPYYEMAQRLGNDAANALLDSNPDVGFVAMAAGRSQSNAQFAQMYTDNGSGFQNVGSLDFCPFAQLDGDLTDRTLETFSISNLTDSSNIEVGSIFWINNEAFKLISISETSCEAKRGCLDTVPQTHSDGDYLIFADTLSETDPTEYIASDEIDVKIAAVTSLGEMNIAYITADSLTLNSRAVRPYPPANVEFNSNHWPLIIGGEDEVAITWNERNRLTQAGGTILDFYLASDVSAEAGVEYILRIYNENNVLCRTESSLVLTSYTYDTVTEVVDFGGTVGDIYYNDVSCLMHMNGANGSTTITDNSSFAFTYTTGGTAALSTTQKRFGTASFNPGSGWARHGVNLTPFRFGSGDFTIRVSLYPTAFPSERAVCSLWDTGGNLSWFFGVNSTGKLIFYYSGDGTTGIFPASTGSLTLNTWNDVAVVRSGTTLTFYLGDVAIGTHAIGTASLFNSSAPFTIGADGGTANQNFVGYIDELQITKGLARPITILTGEFFNQLPSGRLNGKLRIELESKRDGYVSFYKINHTVKRTGYGFNYGEYYGGV